MKIIREGVFETNSSSSHSLIIKKLEKPIQDNIPRVLGYKLSVEEFGDCGSSEWHPSIDRFYSEMDKLRFILNLLATVCEHRWNDDKMFVNYKYDDEKLQKDRDFYLEQFWVEMINSELFVALDEAIFEETGTHIDFVKPIKSYSSIPFYDCIYIEGDYTIEELLHINETNFDREDFKSRIKEIIFDHEVVIVNADIPYGMEEGIDL